MAVTDLANGVATTDSRWFRYYGSRLLAEYGDLVGQNSGVLYQRHVPGPGVDETVVSYAGSDTANRQWLLGQYRDAYQSFLCPICDYPIRRGPLKFLYWNRKTLKRLQIPPQLTGIPDENYSCPCCATSLFEECPACHHTRHALLPACESCGAIKEPDSVK